MADGVTGTPDRVLTEEQRARGQALIIARDILGTKSSGPFPTVSLAGVGGGEVLALAEYILNGYTVELVTSDDTDEYSWVGAANAATSVRVAAPENTGESVLSAVPTTELIRCALRDQAALSGRTLDEAQAAVYNILVEEKRLV